MTGSADETSALAAFAEGWWPATRIAPLGDGHIHATWLVEPTDALRGRFVLQRLSTAVFTDPRGLMEKVARVAAHVAACAPGWVPTLIPTRSGGWCHESEDGGCWRVWRHVGDARTLQVLDNPAQAESAGRAFGSFQRWLRDLPGDVPDPIPGFMQLDHYLGRLDAVRERGSDGAAKAPELARAFELVDRRRDLAGVFAIRDRLVHADCKVNNLLYRADRDEVFCILDLDTVMHGHWAWDAGDLIRSAASDAAGFSLERFAAVVRGLREGGGIEAPAEAWVLAPRYVALMLGVRFLTDHLEGDWYFRVKRPGDNLARALGQFRVLRDLEQSESAMLAAVR